MNLVEINLKSTIYYKLSRDASMHLKVFQVNHDDSTACCRYDSSRLLVMDESHTLDSTSDPAIHSLQMLDNSSSDIVWSANVDRNSW